MHVKIRAAVLGLLEVAPEQVGEGPDVGGGLREVCAQVRCSSHDCERGE